MTEKTYRINEIFYSLQGEGYHSGRPAVFVRFSGCNLKCPFCDTGHESGTMMGEDEIVDKVVEMSNNCGFVVLTGGEPSLFLTDSLVDRLHEKNIYIAVETNGTHSLPSAIDWITCSPKGDYCDNANIIDRHYNEVKFVFTDGISKWWNSVDADNYFLQPCDTGDEQKNKEIIKKAVNACLDNPKWNISLQLHKILSIR